MLLHIWFRAQGRIRAWFRTTRENAFFFPCLIWQMLSPFKNYTAQMFCCHYDVSSKGMLVTHSWLRAHSIISIYSSWASCHLNVVAACTNKHMLIWNLKKPLNSSRWHPSFWKDFFSVFSYCLQIYWTHSSILRSLSKLHFHLSIDYLRC